jgi:membrane protease YdiL (CAAX protease family)
VTDDTSFPPADAPGALPNDSLEAGPAQGRRLARLRAAAEVLLCSSVPTQFLLVLVLALAGIRPKTDGTLTMPYVVAVSLGDTVLLVALMAWLTRRRGSRLSHLWLGERPVGREVLVGLLLTPVILALVVAMLLSLRAYAPWLHNVPDNPLEALARGGPMNAVLFGLVAIVAGGLREELQRAFLLERFETHLGGRTVGVIVLSAAFGLGHYVQGWDAVLTTAMMGAFWAVVYLRRRSSIAPIVSHSAFNSLEILRVAASAGMGAS